jgi:nucleoside 2-deoxyribosyltransferase
MTKEKNKCFIIMPITTPESWIEKYKGDKYHFKHVLEHLFIPAVEAADFDPIPPKTSGSDIIQAEIIKNLSDADLVLCDMSILNPNVFFELGIRTALDKPISLVIDDKTPQVPFDTNIITHHEYNGSLDIWHNKKDIKDLSDHIKKSYDNLNDHNSLWKYFGISQTGTYKPEDTELGEKIDLIIKILNELHKQIQDKSTNKPMDIDSEILHEKIINLFKANTESIEAVPIGSAVPVREGGL